MVRIGNLPSINQYQEEEEEEDNEAGCPPGPRQEAGPDKGRPATQWTWNRRGRGLATVTCSEIQ